MSLSTDRSEDATRKTAGESTTLGSAALQMLSLITSYRVTQIIHVAATLGIADLLAGEPKRSHELAAATATHAPSLYRVLRALASIGVLSEIEPDLFALTPLGQSLRSEITGSMRAWAMMVGGEHHWQPWVQLLHSVKTGEPAFDHVFSMGPFEYYTQHAGAGQVFQAALNGFTQIVNPAIVASYDFSGMKRIVDVGGGLGSLITSILEANPGTHGVLFDLPSVIEHAAPRFPPGGLRSRCDLVAGNFFEEVPYGGDAYLLKHILHDWDDEQAARILRNCRRGMARGGRLLAVEMVIPAGDTPSFGKLLDIEMLVSYSGRERTEREYTALFAEAGFELRRVIPTEAIVSIVEGVIT